MEENTVNPNGQIITESTGKKIVYAFDVCNPKERYTKTSFVRTARTPLRLLKFIIPFTLALLAALVYFDPRNAGSWMFQLLFIGFIYVMYVFIAPVMRNKQYRKIHAAGEDRLSYTFYEDSVKVKSPSLEVELAYQTAESLMENERFLVVYFPFNRTISIDKQERSEEEISFFRSIIPQEKVRKKEKSGAVTGWIACIGAILLTLLFGFELKQVLSRRMNAKTPQYRSTTYESFVACLHDGHVKDIDVNGNYIEYTFTGHKTDERLYTRYDGDHIEPDELNDLLLYSYGSRYPKTTYESFLACLDAGTVKDVEIIHNRYAEYTFTGRGTDERLYTIIEGDFRILTDLLDAKGVEWHDRTED